MDSRNRTETKTLKVGDIAPDIEVVHAVGEMPDNEDLFEALRKL